MEALKQASSAEAAGRYGEAAHIYETFLKSYEHSASGTELRAKVQVRLARDYFFLHRYKDSLDIISSFRAELSPSQPAPVQVLLIEGLDFLELNQLPRAVKTLRQVLTRDPKSGTARMGLADAMARGGRLMEAAHLYQEQLQSTPRLSDAWYKLSVVYLELGQRNLGAFRKTHPDDPVAKQLVAESLMAQGDYWHAARRIVPLIQSKASGSAKSTGDGRFQPGLHADLGTALLHLGFVQAADKEFRSELASDPECADALLGYSQTEALLGKWETVLSAFRRLTEFHPRYWKEAVENAPDATLREKLRAGQVIIPTTFAGTRAGALWQSWVQGKNADPAGVWPAKPVCEQLSGMQASAPGYWLSEPCYALLRRNLLKRKTLAETAQVKLAEAEFRLGEYSRAEGQAQAVLRKSPANHWALAWLVKSYDALSYQCLLKLSVLNPHSARIHEILARNFADQSRWTQAINEYRSAVRIQPNSPDLHMGLGTVYWQAGQWQNAVKELKKVLAMSPQSAVASFELGDSYIQLQQWMQAIPHLRRAENDASVGPKARLDLSKAEAATGHPDEAIATLQTVLDSDRNGSIHYRLALLYRKMGDNEKAKQMFAVSQKLRGATLQLNQKQARALEKEREEYEKLNQPNGSR